MPSRSTYINHHARTSRLRLVAVKTIFFHILIPLPRLSSNTRLAQSVERWPFKPVVMGSSPMVGDTITHTEEILSAKCCLHNLLPV